MSERKFKDLTPEEQAGLRMARRLGLVQLKGSRGEWFDAVPGAAFNAVLIYRIRPRSPTFAQLSPEERATLRMMLRIDKSMLEYWSTSNRVWKPKRTMYFLQYGHYRLRPRDPLP